jgi:hypothetical protein
MHHQVAADVVGSTLERTTLEIGAGTLNQLQYEPSQKAYDVVEPFRQLYARSPWLKRVRRIYANIRNIRRGQYDRITTIATFEHIVVLPEVVAKAALLLKPKTGQLRVAIPNEGTLWWKLGTLITGFEFHRKYGLDYQVFMRHEHVNTADEIEAVLRAFFSEVECSVFGLSKRWAFYRFYICRRPRLAAAQRYDSERHK